MKNTRIFAAATAVALLTSAFSLIVTGDESTLPAETPVYDSTSDPLVSLSYINEVVLPTFDVKLAGYDSKLAEYDAKIAAYDALLAKYETALAEYDTKLALLTEENAALEARVAELERSGDTFAVVRLVKGQKILADTPLELILRGGTAIAVSITANGVNDVTDGSELMNAAEVPLYHSLLVPRGGDGRGIQITSDEAYIMVRGGYQLVG